MRASVNGKIETLKLYESPFPQDIRFYTYGFKHNTANTSFLKGLFGGLAGLEHQKKCPSLKTFSRRLVKQMDVLFRPGGFAVHEPDNMILVCFLWSGDSLPQNRSHFC
jgi:hypothetical protein